MSNAAATGGSDEDITDEEDAPLSSVRHERPNLGPEDFRASQLRRTDGEMSGVVPISLVGYVQLDSIRPIISDLIQQELQNPNSELSIARLEVEKITSELTEVKADLRKINDELASVKSQLTDTMSKIDEVTADVIELKAEQERTRAEFVQFKQQRRDEAVHTPHASPLLQIEEGLAFQTGTNSEPSNVLRREARLG